MKRIPWVGTNWKMNMDPASASSWSSCLKQHMEMVGSCCNVFVMPPYPLIPQLLKELKGSNVIVGAQNCHWDTSGAHTGEISPRLLKQLGAEIVMVGHAERRNQFNETDEQVHAKLRAILVEGMRAVLCVGEDASVKGNEKATKSVLQKQLFGALHTLKLGFQDQIVVAYEPVWAIGEYGTQPETSEIAASIDMVQNVSSEILGESVPVLYGGSVTFDNSRQLLAIPSVDGLFVGRYALQPEQFVQIIHTAVAERAGIK